MIDSARIREVVDLDDCDLAELLALTIDLEAHEQEIAGWEDEGGATPD